MKLTTQMTTTLNRAMKKAGLPTGWKVSVVGSFLAARNTADLKISEIHAAKRFIEINFASSIDNRNMAPAISFWDNASLINWAIAHN